MKNHAKNSWAAFAVGTVFALGLGLSGMTRPHKVIGFLDVLGRWDPSLIFVMAGAIAVHFVSYKWIRRRSSPLLATKWHVPTRKEITGSLVIGAFLFGVGWGLAGYCPGPAVTALASFELRPLVFFISMLFGMGAFHWLNKAFKTRR